VAVIDAQEAAVERSRRDPGLLGKLARCSR
jgi:hypothetical protein